MHMPKSDIPTKIDAPGAVARHLSDFGVASGAIAAEYFSMGGGADLAPLLEGLKDDACDAAHWGYMISGDVFYWPPGHSVRVDADAEMILFSPQAAHGPVLDHIRDKMSAG